MTDLAVQVRHQVEAAGIVWGPKAELVTKVALQVAAASMLPSATANQVGGFHPTITTSRVAALRNYPNSGSQRERVLLAHQAAQATGLNDWELEKATGIHRQIASNRRGELVKGGWLQDSGTTRPTGLGASGIVWVLTPLGKQRLGLVV